MRKAQVGDTVKVITELEEGVANDVHHFFTKGSMGKIIDIIDNTYYVEVEEDKKQLIQILYRKDFKLVGK